MTTRTRKSAAGHTPGALHAALLVLLCGSVCAAALEGHRCIFDDLSRDGKAVPVATVREVSGGSGRNGWEAYTAAGPGWAPIRIGVFTLDMDNNRQYCTKTGEQRPDFKGALVTCSDRDVFTPEKRATIVNRLLPAAVQMHRDRLLVEPVGGKVILPPLPKGDICAQFTIPSTHFTTGVSNVDMLLYAAAGPTGGTTLAWALTCAQLQNGRPVSGVMNFGPHSVESSEVNVRIAVHEMAHALGFNFQQMQNMKMLATASNVRGKPTILVVESKKTVEKAREHYGCPTINGMELEDEGGPGTHRSHWERRNAKDELMSGISGAGIYSALTMAAFEDMKHYRANWGKEETMVWGRNKGCDLLTKPCLTKGATAFPDMFCTSVAPTLTCTSDRLHLGTCSIQKYAQPLRAEYQYFSDARVSGAGPDDLMDFCPFIRSFSNTACMDGDASAMPGSVVGPMARCLKGKGLTIGRTAVGDICADVQCGKNGVVNVRYRGDPSWYPCKDGLAIETGATFSAGKIMCPRYEEVCMS